MATELTYRSISPFCLPIEPEEFDCSLFLKTERDPFIAMESRVADMYYSSEDELDDLNEYMPSNTETSFTRLHQSDNGHVEKGQEEILTGGKTTEQIYREALAQAAAAGTYTVNVPVAEAWIRDNFECQPTTSVARSTVYQTYLKHCTEHDVPSCNPATFGKVIRNMYPNLKTRRIGVRGQSKYHYYGIGPTEQLKGKIDCSYGKRTKNRSSVNESNFDPEKQIDVSPELLDHGKIELSEEDADIEAMLENFPSHERPMMPRKMKKKLEDFLSVYRLHIKTILKAVMKADFEKVTCLLTEFWNELPTFYIRDGFIDQPEVIHVITLCDKEMFSAISNILIPDPQLAFEPRLMQYVELFINSLDSFVIEGLGQFPYSTQQSKLSVCRHFQKRMRHQLQFCHLYTSCRSILQEKTVVRDMARDIMTIDVNNIVSDCNSLNPNPVKSRTARYYVGQFQSLLLHNASLEDHLKFIDTIIDEKLIEMQINGKDHFEGKVRTFVMEWSYISGKIIQQLSMTMSQSLGSFHLLDVFFRDHLISKMKKILKLDAFHCGN